MEAGFCFMSKGNPLLVLAGFSKEPACLRRARPVSASVAPLNEHSLTGKGTHVARSRASLAPCIGSETAWLHWKVCVKSKRNKWCGVMFVFTSQALSPDTWPQKTRCIIFQNMEGEKKNIFERIVSSAVLVLAIRGR